ncbi:MAG TPA: efflux RND transporter periplasmic adaptor subunit [Terriglobales bacterium]
MRLTTARKRRYWDAVLVCLLTAMLSACNHQSGADPKAQGPMAIPVKVQVAQNVPVSDSSEYVASLKSRDSAVIMPQVEGWITEIYVHSGEAVGEGARLMQIDPAKQQATVRSQQSARAAQEASVTYAREQYQRTNGLYRAGVVSKQDLDQAKSALDASEAQLQALDAQLREQQVQLHYYTVNATRGGIVGDVPVRVGDRVTTTTTLTTIDEPGSLEAYIYVPIERSGQLKKSMLAQIVDGEGQVIADSRVTFISPRVDDTTQTVLVKAAIANRNDRLRNAQFIRARIIWGTRPMPVAPVLAVSRLGGQYFAFIAEPAGNGYVARQKPLRIGQMVGNDYAVLDGIKPGDRIIVSGTQFLVDGMPVIPQG